ncbi:MAG: glycosyltransferase [Lachnospiraceae bacterium]|jgi:glycosyltransferase involved in cell wall biosynthesis|nr:glycosyltransferase family 2 protein [uncultured Acetatifactor sp.]MCI9218162.1 glycosyltransferase [Lachnospiraceae bacterium]
MQPLVSIITPSYNQKRFIRETIESVLAQDYENVEYIIIDGGSTDGSLDIIREYEGKLICVSEKDNGQSDAINKGFKMAHGEIVAWLNSDDVYEPGCISRAVEEFQKNDRLGLLYGDGYITDEQSNKVKVFEYTQDFDYWKLVNFWDYIMQPATFFRKETLEKVGYLDVNLHYCMDWDLWIKLAAVSEVKYIPELLACSREYGETKTSTGGDRRLEEIIGLLRKYSGKEKPLGVESYKASTFYTKHANDIWPIRKFAGLYLTYKHKWLEKQMPQRYTDGWIGKRYAISVPGYAKEVSFTAECVLPDTLPQTIDMYVDGSEVEKKEITQLGSQKIEIELKEKKYIHEILLECNNVAQAGNGDNRWLGVRIVNIAYEE